MRLHKSFNKIKEDKGLVFSIISGLVSRLKVCLNKNIIFGNDVKFIGSVIIDHRNSGQITIGNNVLFRSRNRGYHGQINGKMKLMVEYDGEIKIGDDSRIYGSCIHASNSIHIGKRCLIASNVQIFDRNGHDVSFSNPENRIQTFGKSKPIVIEDDVWIGTNAVILPGSIIRSGCVIMANSVVKGTFSKKSLIGGVPAKVWD